MDTVLYYTFSTIAQALAGGIALLGAFVLYRFQILAGTMDQASQYLCETFYNRDRRDLIDGIEQAHFKADYGNVCEIATQYLEDGIDPRTIGMYRSTRTRLRSMVDLRRTLTDSFNRILWPTVGLIVASVLVLILTPMIYVHSYTAWSILAIGLLWFAGCFFGFAVVVRKALEI